MNADIVYMKLIDEIKEKVPQRGKLTGILSNLLSIEKEAVYRRLRGEVPFSFSEIALIAIKLGISLDNLTQNAAPINHSLYLREVNFLYPSENDYQMLQGFIDNACYVRKYPDSECGQISNMIPIWLCSDYKFIYKFYLFKWWHQFHGKKALRHFSEVTVPDRIALLNKQFVEEVRQAKKSVYILDKQFLMYLADDIHYFLQTRLISKEDVKLLKEDLFLFLSDLERYAGRGCFDTGGKLSLYLSNIYFDTCYGYISMQAYKITMVRSFMLSEAYTLDEVVLKNVKKWMQFLKRTSTLISESSEIERIEFFENQRTIVSAI